MLIRMILALAACAATSRAETLEQAVEDYLVVAEKPPQQAWSVTGQLGLTVTDGNSDTITFAAGVEAIHEFDPWKVILKLNAIYAESSGVETANEQVFIGRVERKVSERGALFAQLLLEQDNQETLDIRILFTAGYQRHLVRKEEFNLWGEVGAGVLFEDFGATDETAGSAHLGVNWAWQITPQLHYTQSFLFLPNLSEGGEFIFVAESVFSTPISERLDVRLTILDRFDSEPVAGNTENDIQVTLTIAIKFLKG